MGFPPALFAEITVTLRSIADQLADWSKKLAEEIEKAKNSYDKISRSNRKSQRFLN